MSEISTEELARWLEPIMIGPLCLAPLTNAEHNACSDALTEAAARLRALAEDAERLDWLEENAVDAVATEHGAVLRAELFIVGPETLRAAIDKARHD